MKSTKLIAAIIAAACTLTNFPSITAEVGTKATYQSATASVMDTDDKNDTVKALVTSTAPAAYEATTNQVSEPTNDTEEMQATAVSQETEHNTEEFVEPEVTTAAQNAESAKSATEAQATEISTTTCTSETSEATSVTTVTSTKKRPPSVEYEMFPGESEWICEGVYFTAKRLTLFQKQDYGDYIKLSANNCSWFAIIADKATENQYCPVQYQFYQELEASQKVIFAYWGLCDGDFYDVKTEYTEEIPEQIHHTGDAVDFGAKGAIKKDCVIGGTKGPGYYDLYIEDENESSDYLIFDAENQSRYEAWINYMSCELIYTDGEYYVYKTIYDYDFVEWDPSQVYTPYEVLIEDSILQQGDLMEVNGVDGIALCNMNCSVKKIDDVVHVYATCTDSNKFSAEYIFLPLNGRENRTQEEKYRNDRFKVVVQEVPWGREKDWYTHNDLITWGVKSEETISFAAGEIKTVGSDCSYYAVNTEEVVNATHVANTTKLESSAGWTAMIVVDDSSSALTKSDDWRTCLTHSIYCAARGEIPGHIDTTTHFENSVDSILDRIDEKAELENTGHGNLTFAPIFRWGDASLTDGVFRFCDQEREYCMGQIDWSIWAELQLYEDLESEDNGTVHEFVGAEAPIEYAPNCSTTLHMANWRWSIDAEVVDNILTVVVEDGLKANAAKIRIDLGEAESNSSTIVRWDDTHSCYSALCVYDNRAINAISRIITAIDYF